MATMQTVIDEIKKNLTAEDNNPLCINERLEILSSDAQQAKDSICKSIGNAIESLRMREQLLIRHVNQICECIALGIHTDAEKAAEIRGKLKTCIEFSKLSPGENLQLLISFAKECLLESQQLTKQDRPYEQGSLTFVHDDSRLTKSIEQFGRILNTNMQTHAEGSERSWEFAGSDVMSYASENFEVHKRTESPCHGICTGSTFEIEDLDKYFGMSKKEDETPFLTLSQFCKANEVCQSIKDCLFDEPCSNVSPRHIQQPNVYVLKILQDMNEIGNPEAAQKNLPESLEEQSDFQRTMSCINEQFQHIMQEGVCERVQQIRSDFCDETIPCCVDSLACQIDKIANGTEGKKKMDADDTSSPALTALASEIDAIINSGPANEANYATLDLSEELKKLNLNLKPSDTKSPHPCSTTFHDTTERKKSAALIPLEKHDSEKLQENDGFEFLENITGSTTLDDLHDALTDIIDS